jgi:hypothetical protein
MHSGHLCLEGLTIGFLMSFTEQLRRDQAQAIVWIARIALSQIAPARCARIHRDPVAEDGPPIGGRMVLARLQ